LIETQRFEDKCKMEKEKGHSTGNKRNTYALSVTKISFDSGEKG